MILVLLFLNVWIIEFTRPNSRHNSASFFPFSVCRINLTFPSTLKALLFVAVATLLRHQSAVNCSRTNVKGNFKLQSELLLLLSFPALEFK